MDAKQGQSTASFSFRSISLFFFRISPRHKCATVSVLFACEPRALLQAAPGRAETRPSAAATAACGGRAGRFDTLFPRHKHGSLSLQNFI